MFDIEQNLEGNLSTGFITYIDNEALELKSNKGIDHFQTKCFILAKFY